MRSVVDRALRELEYAYETLVRVEAEIVQQEFNPQFAQIAAPSDMVLVVSFELRIGEKKGTATICVPFATLAPVLEHLASQSLFQDQRGEDPDVWQQQARDGALPRSGRAHVRFASVALTSSEIVALASRRHRAAESRHRRTASTSPSTACTATTRSPAGAASGSRASSSVRTRSAGWH